jgi:hypothetical protein
MYPKQVGVGAEKRRTGLRDLIGPGSHGRKTQSLGLSDGTWLVQGEGTDWLGQRREKKRKTDSEKDRSELLILFQDCEHKLHLNFQDLGYQAQRFVFCQNIRQRNLRSFQEKIMCANNKTTLIEKGQEIEVIEGGWKENYKFFHACNQLHPVLL